jgi:hypothetical protein
MRPKRVKTPSSSDVEMEPVEVFARIKTVSPAEVSFNFHKYFYHKKRSKNSQSINNNVQIPENIYLFVLRFSSLIQHFYYNGSLSFF